jgi:asparagine synthase (glutamine-hydrolysing)
MCGIAGGWWKGSAQADSRLSRALEKIRYRGPDDSGYELYPVADSVVALGHTRLSILDLSSAGHQPMLSADKRLSIVFNGEIYNYRELRAELQGLGHGFVSDSDTEVLLAAWAQWGRACLERLAGMFAFVVLDRQAGTLTCVRDAFGIKPFFYAAEGGEFYFASEMPALKELLPRKPALDWQRAYDYLVHGDYDSGPRTFFEGVSHLLPGHLFTVDLQARRVGEPHRWWARQRDE